MTAVMAVGLAACSSGAAPTTTSSSTSAPSTTSTTLPSLAISKTEIGHAYMTLFDLNNPAIAPKLLVVQDGAALKAAFTAAIHSALAKQAGGAKVLAATVESGADCKNQLLPSPCAAVTYDILSPTGTVVLSNSKGAAVYEDSTWLVAKATICSLLTLEQGKTPAGC
jgi:hypothetical protein